MKKIITLICIGCMALTILTGCGKKKESVFITNVEELNGKKIGVQEGTTGDIYATDIEGAELSRFKKAVDAAIDLKNGKIDAVILDEQPAKKIVENNKDLVILDEQFTSEDYAIAVAKGNEELLQSINATIARMKEEGSFKTFLDAYIPESGDPVKLEERPATNFADEIVMGTNAEFEPFEFRDGDKIVGFDIEMAHEIANDLQMNLKVEDMNFDSLINALSSGKVDMVLAGMTITDERKESVDFSDSYYTSNQVIIVRKTSNTKPEN
jgi:polar amino acid transport system substrate-binding protein